MISKIAQTLFRIGSIPQINRFTQGKIDPHIRRMAIRLSPSVVVVDGGYRIKTDETDSLELRIYHEYEPEVRQTMRSILKDGGFAIDIGANIGYHTVMMSDLADRVLAFEPEHGNLDLLKWNLSENRCNNVSVIPKAVSSRSNCRVKLWKHDKCCGGHSIAFKTGENYEEVETVRLDDIVSPQPIRLIKIDIEGAEYDAILGFGSLLDHVDYIIYESWGLSKDPAKLLEGWDIINIVGINYLARRKY